MKPTRRQFVGSVLTSAALLTVAGKVFAQEGKATDKNASWKTIDVADGTQMRVFVAHPPSSATKVPGVLVLQEAFGVNAHIRDVTQRIAKLGYVAAAPELYHRTAQGFEGSYEDFATVQPHMQAMTQQGLEADLRATYHLLVSDPQVDDTRVGAVGYCMGGRAAFVANAVLPLKAAISYYGGGIAKQLDLVKDQHGPILLFWGGQDKHIGRDQQIIIADALRAAGKEFSDMEFSDADHGFFCDARKSYNPAAARESWALLVEFFKEHL